MTPDFTVVFVGPYEIVGEVKRAFGNQDVAIEANYQQLKRYDKEGIIDALVRGQRPSKIKSGRVIRARRGSNDTNQMPLF